MIRWKVFLRVVGTLILVSWIFVWCLDGLVKRGIEDAISAMTGTKTDIRDLKISLFNSSMKIRKIEIASAKDNFKNLLEVADLVVDFRFLPLLEKKVIVDEFSVRGIDWGTKRRTSGYLPPPSKPKTPSVFSGWVDEAFDQVEGEFAKMPVAQLMDFEVPENPKEVLALFELQSEKAFKDSVVQFQESQGKWKTKIRDLKDVSEYERIINEIRTLSAGVPNDPREILSRVQNIQKAIKLIDQQKSEVEDLAKDVSQESKALNHVYENAVSAIQADYEKAKNLVSLDQFKVENLSRLLFGPAVFSYYRQALRMQSELRRVQSVLVDTKDPEVEVKLRAKGRDIIFVRGNRMPGFVLAKSEFSVEGLNHETAARLSQRYQVKLADINSAPRLWGRPTKVEASGQFREGLFSSANLDFIWDYTKEIPKDFYQVSVQKLKAKDWVVGIPKVYPIKIGSALTNIKTDLSFVGDEMKWSNRIEFSDVVWDFKEVPKVGFFSRVLSDVFQRVKDFNLEIELKRVSKKFDFNVRSNLDNLLKGAIEAEIKERLAAFQAKLRAEIDRRVDGTRQKALLELKKYRSEIGGNLEDRLAQLVAYRKEGEAKIRELENRAKGEAEKKVKAGVEKQLGDKLKKLKLPGL